MKDDKKNLTKPIKSFKIYIQLSANFSVSNALHEGLEKSSKSLLSRGSYSVDVLKAAIYFVTQSSSFKEALELSLEFSGACNYCPVFVGGLGGLRWGLKRIEENQVLEWHTRQWEKEELNRTDTLVCQVLVKHSENLQMLSYCRENFSDQTVASNVSSNFISKSMDMVNREEPIPVSPAILTQ